MIKAIDISSSALAAQRQRMNIIATNMANAFTTAQSDGRIEPYRRQLVTFSQGDGRGGAGVHVASLEQDESPPRLAYEPAHPHAIPDGPLAGNVRYPNVDLATEYVDALEASRAYEANLAVLGVTKSMTQQALQILA